MSQPQGNQANSQTRPRSGSRATSAAARRGWGRLAGWDAKIRPLGDAEYDNLPEVRELRDLVKQSYIIPEWLPNPESPQYDLYRVHTGRFRDIAELLAQNVSDISYTQNKDDNLSADVAECLPSLLQIVRQVESLQMSMMGLQPAEAERRHPIDTLGSLIWDTQSDALIYRLERALQLPGAPGTYTKPDACAFIQMPYGSDLRAPFQLRQALSCFHRTKNAEAEHRHILHWVTEFKRGGDKAPSQHQVVKGLVSALLQRRALGFPNHFIFGTAHHSHTLLEVLAATWVPSESVDSGVDSKQEVDTQSAAPPVEQENNPAGNPLPEGDTTGETPEAGPKLAGAGVNLTAKDIKKYNKIVVYSLATYSMRHVEDLLQLYLLMRQTGIIAREYRKEIMKRSGALIKELSREANDIYQWPPPPLPDSDQGSQPTTSKKRKLSDAPENSTSVVEYDDSDFGSDQEESDSASDVGCKHGITGNSYAFAITGDVATYTIKNYAYKGDAGAGVIEDPYIAR